MVDAGMGPSVGNVEAMFAARDSTGALRFVLCGSAEHGKSALLGRLLRDSKATVEDRSSESKAESRNQGRRDDPVTIEYRDFETSRRKYLAIDAPGDERHTRNMAAGASNADLALVLVDARKSILTQTRRHGHVVSLMGIRRAILAVNKMDLVDYEQDAFQRIADQFRVFMHDLGIDEVVPIPVSALTGENVLARQGSTPWYRGPTLMEALESTPIEDGPDAGGFRLPVQSVNRPNSGCRGYSGTVASGLVERGMRVIVSPPGTTSTVERILGPSGDLESAVADRSITLVLADDVDVSPGDMIAAVDRPPELADQFAAHVVWMDTNSMLPERPYLARFASASALARITDLTHRIDVETMNRLAAKTLQQNEIGYCKVALDRPVPFDPFRTNRTTGSFVLIDRYTDATVGAGMIRFPLRRASNVVWQDLKIDKAARARDIGQTPCVLWLTGLSGAGKSTIADRLEQKLQGLGKHTYLLDGDNVRHGLNRDLGFTDRDRVENIRRIAEVAYLMVDAGLIVIVAFISPFRSERQMARDLLGEDEFFEVFVDTPLPVCEARDPKGLYAKARKGDIVNFTGIDSPYEPPQHPELRIDTTVLSPDLAADEIAGLLESGSPVPVAPSGVE